MNKPKPTSCIGCRCYNEPTIEVSQGAARSAVLFLGASPPPWGGLFSDRSGKLVRTVISEVVREEAVSGLYKGVVGPAKAMDRKKRFMYAVHCHAGKLDKEVVEKCAGSMTHTSILRCDPDVILAMGNDALRSLGISAPAKKVRGQVLTANIKGKSYRVVPTISPVALIKDSMGQFSLFKSDVKKAAETAYTEDIVKLSLSDLKDQYDIPETLEEVIRVCEEYSAYQEEGKSVKNSMMSLDTETNTLTPWAEDAKIIMVSASVDSKKACAILLEHRLAPYDWKLALPWVLKMTMSDHPKTWWNYKYDLQMFKYSLIPKVLELSKSDEYRRNLENIVGKTLEEIVACAGINNTRWDGLLGEHLLDEDKKGHYSLKAVVADYCPEYAGYEEELKEQFMSDGEETIAASIEALKDPLYQTSPYGDSLCKPPFGYLPNSTISEVVDAGEGAVDNAKKSLARLRRTKNKTDSDKAKMVTLRERRDALQEWLKNQRACERARKKEIKALAKKLRQEAKEATEVAANKTYEDLDVGVLSVYAAIDADITRTISKEQRRRAHREDPPNGGERHRLISLMSRHYLPLTEMLADMQAEGVYLDRRYMSSLADSLGKAAAEKESEIKETIHRDLGIPLDDIILNNPKFLGDTLIGGYGLPKLRATATGQASMSVDTLTQYAEQGNQVASAVLDWRKTTKAKSTYVDRLGNLSAYDGKVHGSVHLNGTATGRTSSSNPNLQNTPHKIGDINIKKIFIPTPVHEDSWWESDYNRHLAKRYHWDREDRLSWIDLDFSGAEVRVLTRYAPDQGLIEALKEGLDVHSWMTAEVHGYEYEEVNLGRKEKGSIFESLRSDTKRVVFGTLYGITAHGLQERMGFTEERAQEIIDKLMDRFPLIRAYINDTQKEISKKKRVITPFGRFRRFPMVTAGKWAEGRNHRQGVNFLIQSYCSDIVMSCMLNVAKNISDVRGRLLLTVHDSVCCEVPVKELPRVPKFLEDSITQHIQREFPDLEVPMPYDVLVGDNYGETDDLDKILA